DVLHDLPPAGIGSEREPTADYLAEGDDIGIDAVPLDGATGGDAEPRHDLIEQQERAVLPGDVAKPLEETLGRLDHTHVAGYRLDDDRGDVLTMLVKEPFH